MSQAEPCNAQKPAEAGTPNEPRKPACARIVMKIPVMVRAVDFQTYILRKTTTGEVVEAHPLDAAHLVAHGFAEQAPQDEAPHPGPLPRAEREKI